MLQRFSIATLPSMPWKNGGGSTCEIACWPPGAGLGDFAWRMSIASISQSGPFSIFRGVDRSIMLLEGDGVHLRASQTQEGGIDHRLDTPLQPFAFSGDSSVQCTLLGGPSRDFNVMTRRGQWHADVQVLSTSSATAVAMHGLLLSVRCSWQVSANQAVLHAGGGLVWTEEAVSWHIEPQRSAGAQKSASGPLLLLVRLEPGKH